MSLTSWPYIGFIDCNTVLTAGAVRRDCERVYTIHDKWVQVTWYKKKSVVTAITALLTFYLHDLTCPMTVIFLTNTIHWHLTPIGHPEQMFWRQHFLVLFLGSDIWRVQNHNIGLGNGVVPLRHNAIAWTNNDPVHKYIYIYTYIYIHRQHTQATRCGLLMPYGDIDLGQHWLR